MVDHVLREHPWNDASPNPFRFIGNRTELGHTINLYLVILAAEIKFRRYLAVNGPPLPPVYDSLMRKTIEVAQLLYFRLVWDQNFPIPMEHMPVDMKVYAPLEPTEMGFQTGADGSTASGSTTHQQRPTTADGDGATRRADADYWRDMLSGRRFNFYCPLPY